MNHKESAAREQNWNCGHVAVIGIGGVGGYFGAKLAAGHRRQQEKEPMLSFYARGEHLQAIRENGLLLRSAELGEIRAIPDLATDQAEELPMIDLCLLCVKSYDLDDALRQIRPRLHNDSVILPLLNGIDIPERIQRGVDCGILLPACVYVGTHISAPGIIEQSGGDGEIHFGPDPRRGDTPAATICRLLDDSGIRYQFYDDPQPALWGKYIFIASFGLITAVSGKSLGEVAADPELLRDTENIMREIVMTARARGVRISEGMIQSSLAKAHRFPFETRTSFQRDIEAGRKDEGDLFGMTIIRIARECGLEVPATEAAHQALAARSAG